MEDRSCAFVLVNRRGVVEEWPPRMERITGWNHIEAVGKNIDFIIPSEHKAKHTAGIEGICDPDRWRTKTKSLDFSCDIVGKDGKLVPVRITLFEALNQKRFVAIVLPAKSELGRIKAME